LGFRKKRRSKMTLWDRALYYQSVREHSRHELFQKFKKLDSETEDDEINKVLDRLVDRAFQSDLKYFDSRVRVLLLRRWGPHKIKAALMKAKVPWNEERFVKLREELGESESLRRQMSDLLDKKIRSTPVQRFIDESNLNEYSASQKLQEKLLRFLASRGFSPSEAFRIVREKVENIKPSEN